MNKGKVYLVGAGPGDAGLITWKGFECLCMADVVVYDYLANPVLLNRGNPKAKRIYVGKTGRRHTLEQDEINALLAREAGKGKVVVRLKGGDPFVFGRGSEEALYLRERGIPFEVVPGVTAGIAAPAYAGIPVTHRGMASSVTFITGHEDPTKEESALDWEALARLGTLVFYMGVGNLGRIVEKLTSCGRPKSTPAAVIQWGTTPEQRTVAGTLGDIAEKVKKAGITAPAITIVGEVVRLRRDLRWFEDRPLFGRRILVTRSRTQASDLVRLLEEKGASVAEFPTIEIVPPKSFKRMDEAIRNLAKYQWVIFTSVNGVSLFLERLMASGKDIRALGQAKIAAIGPATASRLKAFSLQPNLLPSEYRAEAVVEAFRKVRIKGQNILLARAEVARDIIPGALSKLGAKVDVLPVYRTVRSEGKRTELLSLLKEGKVDAVTFTSSSTVENFVGILGKKNVPLLKGVALASIGPITTETARRLGLKISIEAKEYTIPGLVKALEESPTLKEGG
jgi:uroporphyrinogen III methyltransferase/synthase